MARFHLLFRCVGESLAANGLKCLCGVVPFGERLYDIARDAHERYRQQCQLQEAIAQVEAAAQASATEVREEAVRVFQEVRAAATGGAADDLGRPAVQAAFTGYLEQLPASVRASWRRPADPTGRSQPRAFTMTRAEDFLRLMPARPPRFQPGQRTVGSWELEELLGVGGFGEVWKARHVFLRNLAPVALKFCLDESAAKALRHEAALIDEMMAGSKSPGVVELRNAHLDHDPPCLEFEWIDGGDLCGLLQQWTGLAPADRAERATRLILQLARILTPLHRLKPAIVHRDLKPANVLVARRDGGKVDLKVADFGIGGLSARHALAGASRGVSRGDLLMQSLRGSHTPLYAPAEQVRGEAPDPRDDVHALGVLWYQILVGDLARGVGPDADEDLRELNVAEPVIALVKRCVARADRRVADAGALADRIRELDAAPPAAIPIPVARPAPPPAPPAAVPMPVPVPPPAARSAPAPAPAPTGPRPDAIVCARGTGTHRQIKAALEATAAGGLVHVRPGVYREGLVLARPVTLVGLPREATLTDTAGHGVVLEVGDADCILSRARGAVVRGFSLRCVAGRASKNYFGVDVTAGDLLLEDCDVSSDALAGVAVHGDGVSAILRNCQVHDGNAGGVFVFEKGRATLEGCKLFGNRNSGLIVQEGATATARDCKVHDSREGCGIYVHTDARATLERCDVSGNPRAGVEVKNAVLTARGCTLHDGQASGIFAHEKATGSVEECDFGGNRLAGVEVRTGADLVIRRCKLHHSKEGGGVYVHTAARATVEGCEIFANQNAGVIAKTTAVPTVLDCIIRDNLASGVFVYDNGGGTFEGCTITGNKNAGVEIKEGSDPTFRRCTIRDGLGSGAFIYAKGRGTLESCTIASNKLTGVEIKEGGDPTVRACTITGSPYEAVYVHEGGKGTIMRCDLRGNKKGAWDIRPGCEVTRSGNVE